MKRDKKFVLVLSGWWSKCFYSLWIIKALEELHMQDKIDAIFWVSAWAMIAVYWASWWNVDSICERYISNISNLSAKNLKLPPITSLMQEKPILRVILKIGLEMIKNLIFLIQHKYQMI